MKLFNFNKKKCKNTMNEKVLGLKIAISSLDKDGDKDYIELSKKLYDATDAISGLLPRNNKLLIKVCDNDSIELFYNGHLVEKYPAVNVELYQREYEVIEFLFLVSDIVKHFAIVEDNRLLKQLVIVLSGIETRIKYQI